MPNKKIFILLPDGVGLRNFAFSNFYKIGIEKKFDITYWNNTPFDLTNLGFNEVKINEAKSDTLTDSYKNARKHIELNLNKKRENDNVYDTYRFPFLYKSIKTSLKSYITRFLILAYNSEKGLKKVRDVIKNREKKTNFYKQCIETLRIEKPNFVFCTNQRPVLAIAPILAAKELQIPTGTFIFSWDNLPKATMVIETDYYFVWSDHMKSELLKYYSYIEEKKIFVVGTPQFESHFDKSILSDRIQFFNDYKLDLDRKYICYSGDDITTCPDDSQYLSDVADAVREINKRDNNTSLGIIFRRCPVDFSGRYDAVLQKNRDLITAVDPIWKKIGEDWNTILPTKEDVKLLSNTIFYSEMVINLGSSMVFDSACFKKPCAYLNYDVKNKIDEYWSVSKIYKYVHFRSMPNKNVVVWLNSSDEIADKIKQTLKQSDQTVENAQEWFKIINDHPAEESSDRIWEAITEILN